MKDYAINTEKAIIPYVNMDDFIKEQIVKELDKNEVNELISSIFCKNFTPPAMTLKSYYSVDKDYVSDVKLYSDTRLWSNSIHSPINVKFGQITEEVKIIKR